MIEGVYNNMVGYRPFSFERIFPNITEVVWNIWYISGFINNIFREAVGIHSVLLAI